MNKLFLSIYILLVIIIIIELLLLFSRLSILKKELDKTGIELESIENNLDKVKASLTAIEETKNSWKFLLSILLILSIFRMAKKDYKKNKNTNKSYLSSLAKVCAKNITTISKIKVI